MIHFFRRIRQTLLNDNKYRKYLFYALGEIALVMIGILLALQVNNWNQHRKTIALEHDLLSAIKDEIIENTKVLKEKSISNKMYMNSAEIILEALDNSLPYHDSLDVHFSKMARIESIFFAKASFETLKSSGVGIVREEETRRSIINLFEKSYKILDEHESLGSANELLAPYLIKRFRWGFGLGVPQDYNSLLDDTEFKNAIFYMMNTRNNIDLISSQILGNSEHVLSLINDHFSQSS